MFYYVATRSAHGLQPYNFALSAEEALMFVNESSEEGFEVEVLDATGQRVSREALQAACTLEASGA